jgi:hypothetical protein
MMRSALYTLNWIYIVLAHWNNSLRIDMSSHSRHIILIPSQPVFVLSPYNDVCLAEKQHIQMLKSLVWPDKGSNLRSTTLEVNSLTITPPVPFRVNITFCFDPEVITCSTSLSSFCTDDSPILWTWWNNDIILMRAAWVFFVFQLKNTDYVDNCLPCFDKEDILGLGFMVFNATFNNISTMSWWSVLLVDETGVPGENHRPVARHWKTLSHTVVHLALIEIGTHNISGDRHWLHRYVYI